MTYPGIEESDSNDPSVAAGHDTFAALLASQTTAQPPILAPVEAPSRAAQIRQKAGDVAARFKAVFQRRSALEAAGFDADIGSWQP